MQDYLKKKFSLGINPCWSIYEIKYLLGQYSEMLESIYFSPPFASVTGQPYCTMKPVEEEARRDQFLEEKISDAASFAKELGIRCDVVINSGEGYQVDLDKAYKFIKKIDAEDVTLTLENAWYFDDLEPKRKYIYSFNSKKPSEKEYSDPLFSTYVLDSQYIWEKDLRPKNKESKILTNSGCPSKCPGCHAWTHEGDSCKSLLVDEIKEKGVEGYLAYHILLAKDVELFSKHFPDEKIIFKIGSRLNHFNAVNFYLKGFKYEVNIQGMYDIFNRFPQGRDIIWRYSQIAIWLKENEYKIDFTKFNEEKNKLWSAAVGLQVKY